MNTLLLDSAAWDLCITASGDIAMAGEPYSLAQDAASAIRLFQGEFIYSLAIGIPYFEEVLGEDPPIERLRSYMVAAAETVPDVAGATVYFSAIANGQVSGQVQISNANGSISAAGF